MSKIVKFWIHLVISNSSMSKTKNRDELLHIEIYSDSETGVSFSIGGSDRPATISIISFASSTDLSLTRGSDAGNDLDITLTYFTGIFRVRVKTHADVSFRPGRELYPQRPGPAHPGREVRHWGNLLPQRRIKQFNYGNGVVHTLTQNTRGLPLRSTDCTLSGTCASANRRLDLQYAYDGVGNVTTITDQTATAKQTRGMTYDGLDRLTQTTSPTAVFNTASYSYDQLDNLLTVNVTGGNYTRNHTYVYDATSKRLSQVKNTV